MAAEISQVIYAPITSGKVLLAEGNMSSIRMKKWCRSSAGISFQNVDALDIFDRGVLWRLNIFK